LPAGENTVRIKLPKERLEEGLATPGLGRKFTEFALLKFLLRAAFRLLSETEPREKLGVL
jgi:hypothetical protein